MKPILFNTEMVRAILDGHKTVTRRLVKDKDIINQWDCESDGTPIAYVEQLTGDCYPPTVPCHYRPGDILYVRETWRVQAAHRFEVDARVEYKAGGSMTTMQFPGRESQLGSRTKYDDFVGKWADDKWHPSIHMPKEAARLFLRVTDVRVERLQDITSADCEKEGIDLTDLENLGVGVINHETYTQEFQTIWDSTIKKADLPLYGWNANPWVWVIEFERISKEAALKGGAE